MFHNLSGYDAHLFIRELGAHTSEMGVITKNKEDYISFSIKVSVEKYIDKEGNEKDKLIELRFIDSFKFMSSSLDSLTKNLVGIGKRLLGFEDYSDLQYDLLTRKGVYPYEYVNSWDRFEETQLPPISAFYSNLNMSSISEEDYQHAQKVWKEFGIHNLGDYHDLYLRIDVVLLANVYDAFRDTCLKHYKLDPAHFYTSPGLAWPACLKHTGIRDRFEETQLPPISAFYSNLNMSSISEEDYQHAQKVWKEFGIHNLGDYHDLYLRIDVVLLANVYDAFRDTCLKHYKLDPAHFYTSPGLAWPACLKHTGIRLELLTDPDMLLMFERGIRGGITQAVCKYASANNKYMGDRFDPKSESS